MIRLHSKERRAGDIHQISANKHTDREEREIKKGEKERIALPRDMSALKTPRLGKSQPREELRKLLLL